MKKIILFTILALFLLFCTAIYQYYHFNDGKLHIIFCDVGQGDAILIRTPEGKYILVDGGPDRKVVACLAKYMPFWQRTIDLMLLTHPHADHFFGMFYVLDRYLITSFGTEKLDNKSDSFQEFLHLLKEKEIAITYVSAGDRWVMKTNNSDVVFSIVSPSLLFLQKSSPNGQIGEGKEFASLVTHISYGAFDVLLTGDSQARALSDAVDGMANRLDILQVPHHGSATGLTRAFLQKEHPKLTIISVGSMNRYGHPNKNILENLISLKIPFLRTDKSGDIEIISDGNSFYIK